MIDNGNKMKTLVFKSVLFTVFNQKKCNSQAILLFYLTIFNSLMILEKV